MEADNPAWVPPEAGAVRTLSLALMLMDQTCALKHDQDLGNRLTDQPVGLRSCDAVLAAPGLQNDRKRPDCGTPAWEHVVDLAWAGDVEMGTVILTRDHEYLCEDRIARRVREDPVGPPADAVNLAGEMRAIGLTKPED